MDFVKFMNDVLSGLEQNTYCFVEDILVYSNDLTSHLEHLRQVFQRFQEYGLTGTQDKCCFAREKLTFLGFELSRKGLRPLESRVADFAAAPRPQTIKELRACLGTFNFYKNFCRNSAIILAPLNRLLSGAKPNSRKLLNWLPEHV